MVRRAVAALAGAVLGCGGGEAGSRDAAPVDDAGAVAPDARADAGEEVDSSLAFVSGPTFALAPAAPLSGLLELATNRPTRVAVAIADPDRSFTVELPALASQHAVPVHGFRPGTPHTVAVTVTDESGETLAAIPFEVVTGPLPAGFPSFTATLVLPSQIEPGVTLTGMREYVLAVDATGEVVWYANTGPTADVRRLPSGNLLVGTRDLLGAAEIDMLGNVVRRWHAANTTTGPEGSVGIAIDSFHHELGVLPGGDMFTLSTERRSYDGYPTSETDPTPQDEPQDLIGDVAVVFEPDGPILQQWSMLDVVDPYRVGYGSFGAFWTLFYGPGVLDWSHGNGMFPDPADGGYLVSLRHQDAVVKIDASGQLVWILGTHDNWGPAFAPYLLDPVGDPFAWQFHQHAPRILPGGNLMLFDNGNFRVSPPDPIPPTSYSRAVEYAVDPVAMEVRQVWEYDAGGAIYAAATGDVDVGPATGNVIITFGIARRIVEVTHDQPAAVVFEMESSDPFYRAERLPSLYPTP